MPQQYKDYCLRYVQDTQACQHEQETPVGTVNCGGCQSKKNYNPTLSIWTGEICRITSHCNGVHQEGQTEHRKHNEVVLHKCALMAESAVSHEETIVRHALASFA